MLIIITINFTEKRNGFSSSCIFFELIILIGTLKMTHLDTLYRPRGDRRKKESVQRDLHPAWPSSAAGTRAGRSMTASRKAIAPQPGGTTDAHILQKYIDIPLFLKFKLTTPLHPLPYRHV